jgi:hypothetical protein
MNLKATQLSETSVVIYQSTRRNIPEDLNLQQHRCENLKSLYSNQIWLLIQNLLQSPSPYLIQSIFAEVRSPYWRTFGLHVKNGLCAYFTAMTQNGGDREISLLRLYSVHFDK